MMLHRCVPGQQRVLSLAYDELGHGNSETLLELKSAQ
jgi:hypothetical protein